MSTRNSNRNSNRARFGPATKWEGSMTETMTKTDWSPVRGHYTDATSWSWRWHINYHFGAGDAMPKPLVVAIRALRSCLGVGAVAACKVAAADAVDFLGKGGVSRHELERSVKKICKEGAYWGAAAGAFETLEFGAELMRGRSDWKNAMIGGALAGATVSAAACSFSSHGSSIDRHQVIKVAITGGAIGTAFEFISHRRHVDQPRQLPADDRLTKHWN